MITLATGPLATRDEVAGLVAETRRAAGERAGQLEFAAPLFVVGDDVPPWVSRFLQADMSDLVAHDSLQILRGTPGQMADELQRRREVVGTSYVSVNAAFSAQFAPVVDLLSGR
jgi:hypothetical protein